MIKKVTLIGGGVLGSQIAFQSAYAGFDVTIWLRSEESILRTKKKINDLKDKYLKLAEDMAKDNVDMNTWARGLVCGNKFDKKDSVKRTLKAFDKIKYELDITSALKGTDLVIEALAEDLKQKKDFYKSIANILDDKTIVVTNSSTLLPSKMAKSTGREEKFLSLHFANSIWKNNTAEVMMHKKTDRKYFDEVVKFANDINMIALPLFKEKSGYLLNSMLVPLLFSALDLYVNDISDIESIDKAWTKGTGSPKGPFRILDTIGLVTAYNIVKMYLNIPSFMAPYNFKKMEKVLKEYIDAGKLGVSSGEGFYKYK